MSSIVSVSGYRFGALRVSYCRTMVVPMPTPSGIDSFMYGHYQKIFAQRLDIINAMYCQVHGTPYYA